MTEHIFCSIFDRFLKQCTLPSTLVFPTLYSSTFSQHLLPWLVSCKPARPPHPWTRPPAGQPEHNFLPFHNFLVPTWYRLQVYMFNLSLNYMQTIRCPLFLNASNRMPSLFFSSAKPAAQRFCVHAYSERCGALTGTAGARTPAGFAALPRQMLQHTI